MNDRSDRQRRNQERRGQRCVIYARVSSKQQEQEGFSIPAQLKLLRTHAESEGLSVDREFTDVETAKQAGRTAFGEMMAHLRRNPSCRVVLTEKTDRLYRNLKDWVTLDDLHLELHFVKEGGMVSDSSRSSEKLAHGIRVLMAKNYVDNLSEETKKGMREKAEQGIWPSVAPLDYRNVVGPDGRRVIEPDPDVAAILRQLFELYATGWWSIRKLARWAREQGLVSRKRKAPVPQATIHAILRSRIYTGSFEWDGRTYKGTHQPLI